MEPYSFKRTLALGIVALASAGAVGTLAAVGSAASLLAGGGNALTSCPHGHSTNLDWNISHEEIVAMAPSGTFVDFAVEDPSAISPIVTGLSAVHGALFNRADNKEGTPSFPSWKFGSSSEAGLLTITLSKEISAIGLYAVAYNNSQDAGKLLTVNGKDTSALAACEAYDGGDDERIFVELDEPSSEITIASKTSSKNRFHIYSIGFYSNNGFPNAGGGQSSSESGSSQTSEETSEESSQEQGQTTVEFSRDELKGTSPISKGGVTLDNSTDYGSNIVTELRVYKGCTLTISAPEGHTLTGITFECTASGTAKQGPGCFGELEGYSYSGKNGAWAGSAQSITLTASSNQVRITSLTASYI